MGRGWRLLVLAFAVVVVATVSAWVAWGHSSSSGTWRELYGPHLDGIRNPANSIPGLAGGLSVAFSDARHGWITVGAGRTWQSSDGGRSWQPSAGRLVGDRRCGPAVLPKAVADVPGPVCIRSLGDRVLWLAFDGRRAPEGGDESEVTAFPSGLLVSRDAGRTWRLCRALDTTGTRILDLSWQGSSHGWLLTAAAPDFGPTGETVFETHDGGRSWRPAAVERASIWTYDNVTRTLAPSPKNGVAWVASSEEAGALRPAWTTGEQAYWEVGYDSPEYGPETGELLTSSPGGWPALRYDGRFERRPLFGVYFSDDRHGWVGGSKAVWGTGDAGGAWSKELVWPRDERPYHSDQVFCATGEAILLATTVWEGPHSGAVVVWSRPRP